jgi:hypothetical protein
MSVEALPFLPLHSWCSINLGLNLVALAIDEKLDETHQELRHRLANEYLKRV